VTPDTAADALPLPEKQAPSTAGMTTKVVKGSIWTLAGQVAPMMVAFIATPFTIRFLGSESYGVLLLVGLIPMYFSFADFGMGVASTKFAAEAYGQGDLDREREVIWTATAIAALSAMIVAVPIFLFSYQIVAAMNVPEHLLRDASIALKITSASFFFGILAGVLNSPMLARLRMDMNTFTGAVPKILLAAVTPFVLYYGGGIVGAVWWALIVGVAAFAIVFYFSSRLLPGLQRPILNRDLVRPILKFGAGWFVAVVAAILLVNFEKLALTKMVSVTALAYYSIAYTLANIASMFSAAMTQSLVPAFSQLLTPEKKPELDHLFTRALRFTWVWLLPMTAIMVVLAKPFLSFWAGPEFGAESTVPFYILLVGVSFNMLAYIQHSLITSLGRTDLIAKLYWAELFLFGILVVVLIYFFGIIGAALAWSIRVVVDAVIFIVLAKKLAGVSFRISHGVNGLIFASISLLPLFVLAVFNDNNAMMFAAIPICIGVYGMIIWKMFLDNPEKIWLRNQLSVRFGYLV